MGGFSLIYLILGKTYVFLMNVPNIAFSKTSVQLLSSLYFFFFSLLSFFPLTTEILLFSLTLILHMLRAPSITFLFYALFLSLSLCHLFGLFLLLFLLFLFHYYSLPCNPTPPSSLSSLHSLSLFIPLLMILSFSILCSMPSTT